MPPCLVVGNVLFFFFFSFFFFFLKGINFPSKYNVTPLYWSLSISVFCQWLRQIMILSDHSLISLIFSLVNEYLFRLNLEILILHFENKNCFDVSLKQFALEFLQLVFFSFFSWKRDYLLLCSAILSLVKVCHEVTFCFLCVSKVKGSRKSSRFCLRKTYLFLNTYFISMNNNE